MYWQAILKHENNGGPQQVVSGIFLLKISEEQFFLSRPAVKLAATFYALVFHCAPGLADSLWPEI